VDPSVRHKHIFTTNSRAAGLIPFVNFNYFIAFRVVVDNAEPTRAEMSSENIVVFVTARLYLSNRGRPMLRLGVDLG
jgi:hypothetical protein